MVLVLCLGLLAAARGLSAESASRPATVFTHLGPAPRDGSRFKNLDPSFHRASHWTQVRFAILGFFSLFTAPRREPLPAALVDAPLLWNNHHDATVTWIGHSTVLVQLDGLNILTDPNWSPRTGLLRGRIGVGRHTPPGLTFDQLPPIDVVLISHDHYDHLDEPTVRQLAVRWNPLFVVPLRIEGWLRDRGNTNVQELDWGQSVSINGVLFVCTPAQHGSGRTLFDQGHRLWASWAVIGSKRFYFGGDTGYAEHFKEIGEELGPFDLAALPIG